MMDASIGAGLHADPDSVQPDLVASASKRPREAAQVVSEPPGWLTGAAHWYDLNLNLPAFMVEILIHDRDDRAAGAAHLHPVAHRLASHRRDVTQLNIHGFHRRVLGNDDCWCGVPRCGPGVGPPWDVPRIDS